MGRFYNNNNMICCHLTVTGISGMNALAQNIRKQSIISIIIYNCETER